MAKQGGARLLIPTLLDTVRLACTEPLNLRVTPPNLCTVKQTEASQMLGKGHNRAASPALRDFLKYDDSPGQAWLHRHHYFKKSS